MSFFSKLTPPHRVGEKNFERARAAETRKDFEKARQYFEAAAQGFDEHFDAQKKTVKSHDLPILSWLESATPDLGEMRKP